LRGPDGSIIGTVGTALDVTAHSQSEAATHEGEERFRLALQGSPVIVYRQDTDLRYTWIYNPQHGLSPDAVIGKTDAELLRREDAAIQAVIKRKVLATGVGAREQVRVTVGGEVAYYDLTIEPLRDATDKIIGVTGAATNITALKRAEEVLGLRESQLAEAQRLAQLGSWELDLATNQFSWSDEHYRIFGVEPQPGPLSPAMVQATIHPEDYDRAMAIFESSLQTGEPYETELRIILPDGEVRVIHSRGTMLQEASGRPQRMVGTAQDITERKRAEEERTLQRERQARLDGMLFAVHELAARMNDDLTESSGDIALLRPQQSLAPELQNAIDRLAARVSGMIEDIVELQRLILAPAMPCLADVDSAQLVSKRE
jgi:PAS domain S-box-containing protein